MHQHGGWAWRKSSKQYTSELVNMSCSLWCYNVVIQKHSHLQKIALQSKSLSTNLISSFSLFVSLLFITILTITIFNPLQFQWTYILIWYSITSCSTKKTQMYHKSQFSSIIVVILCKPSPANSQKHQNHPTKQTIIIMNLIRA